MKIRGITDTLEAESIFPFKSKNCRWVEKDHRVTILNTKKGKYYSLNRTASFLWQLSDGTRDSDLLARLLYAEFKIKSFDRCKKDVGHLILKLSNEGLLEIKPSPKGRLTVPRVSVIVTTFNGERFISKTLHSIVDQSFVDFEVIVIDDGSTDSTFRIIQKLRDSRIRIIRHKSNLGVSKARNVALSLAKAEYIAYCDHDDIWHKDHLKTMVPVLENRPDVSLVYARYEPVGWPHKIQHERTSFSQELLECENIIGPPLNVLHRRSCIHKVGGFDESKMVAKNSSEDWDLWLRISDSFKVHRVDRVLSFFIYHGNNRTNSMDFFKSRLYLIGKRLKVYEKRRKLEAYVFNVLFLNSVLFIRHNRKSCWTTLKRRVLAYSKRPWKSTVRNYCTGLDLYLRGDFSGSREMLARSLDYIQLNRSLSKHISDTALDVIYFFLMVNNIKLKDYQSALRCADKVRTLNMCCVHYLDEYLAVIYLNQGKHSLFLNKIKRPSLKF